MIPWSMIDPSVAKVHGDLLMLHHPISLPTTGSIRLVLPDAEG
jgi:hypothetical protein